ncbi:MAG: hypothetical protein EXS31_08785 [Pedosphaera sp.]|nr:hypothetical protein [Pedosphaera sp.]
MNDSSLHTECAQALSSLTERPQLLSAFVGMDGFVDEIVHVVDKRQNATTYTRIPTIAAYAARLAGAAGRSTNIELVNQLTKLGGNGPIMANALASFGLNVTYLGTVGRPNLHPVFAGLAKRAEVHSIADACHTDALEFEDGKILVGKSTPLNEVTWPNIQERFGRERFEGKFQNSSLVAFVNWTMIPYMSDIWAALLAELCPRLSGPRRMIFFDLADPEKRKAEDVRKALNLISQFQQHFDVILGLNEKEAFEVAGALGIQTQGDSAGGLSSLTMEIQQHLGIQTLAVHPVLFALAVCGGKVDVVQGPYIPTPLITTGAGDHFNAGFCLGKLLGLSNAMCVLLGVATSGHYVRTAQSPDVPALIQMLRNWPAEE